MTIQSRGYDGTVDEAAFAQLLNLVGRPPIVATPNDLKGTPVTGQRAVRIGNGDSYGTGVVVTISDGGDIVPLATPTNGQFFLIALRRDWTVNQDTNNDGTIDNDGSSLVALAADLTSTSTPSSPPAALPLLETTVGVKADQPLYWAWVTSASTNVTLFDIRAFPETSEHVPTVEARDAIPTARLYPGKIVTVDTIGVRYRRSTSTWHIDGVNPCTSGNRPSDPFLYEQIFETDTSRFGYWNGSAWAIAGVSAGNISGSLNDSNLPERLRATASNVSGRNWNDILESGWYRGQNMSNNPHGDAGWCFTEVMRYDDDYVRQVSFDLFGPGMYTRLRSAGTWSGWKWLPNSEDLVGGALDSRYYTRGQIDSDRATYPYVNGVRDAVLQSIDSGRIDWRAENQINNRGLSRVAAGGVNVNGNSTASVTFPAGRFTQVPYISTGIYTGAANSQHAGIINSTSTGFTMYYAREGSTAQATLNWIAVQPS